MIAAAGTDVAAVEQEFLGALAIGVADRVLSQWPGVATLTGTEYRGAVI